MSDPSSDAALVARARRGDESALDALVRKHARAAYAVARAILGEHGDAEDVCQDAWVRAYERLDDCRQPDRFVYWFLQIVRNRARNYVHYRRVRTHEPLEASTEVAGDPERDDPRRTLRRARRREALASALACLPEEWREVLLLHDLAGWKHWAIAESLGLSEVLCRKRIVQARARMRKLLDERQLDE